MSSYPCNTSMFHIIKNCCTNTSSTLKGPGGIITSFTVCPVEWGLGSNNKMWPTTSSSEILIPNIPLPSCYISSDHWAPYSQCDDIHQQEHTHPTIHIGLAHSNNLISQPIPEFYNLKYCHPIKMGHFYFSIVAKVSLKIVMGATLAQEGRAVIWQLEGRLDPALGVTKYPWAGYLTPNCSWRAGWCLAWQPIAVGVWMGEWEALFTHWMIYSQNELNCKMVGSYIAFSYITVMQKNG